MWYENFLMTGYLLITYRLGIFAEFNMRQLKFYLEMLVSMVGKHN